MMPQRPSRKGTTPQHTLDPLLLLLLSCKSLQSFDVPLGLLCHVSATSGSSETQHFPQYVSCSKDGRQLCTSNDIWYF